MRISIGNFDLTGPIPAEGAQGFRVVPSSQVQTSAGIGAAGVDLYDRGNWQHVVTFAISREHDSAEAALFFCLEHLRLVEEIGKAALTVRTEAGTRYFWPAICRPTLAEFDGCSTTHQYTILAGGIAQSLSGPGAPPGVRTYLDALPPGQQYTVF